MLNYCGALGSSAGIKYGGLVIPTSIPESGDFFNRPTVSSLSSLVGWGKTRDGAKLGTGKTRDGQN